MRSRPFSVRFHTSTRGPVSSVKKATNPYFGSIPAHIPYTIISDLPLNDGFDGTSHELFSSFSLVSLSSNTHKSTDPNVLLDAKRKVKSETFSSSPTLIVLVSMLLMLPRFV